MFGIQLKIGKTTSPLRYDLNQIPYNYTVEVINRFKGLDLIDRMPDEQWFVTLYRRQGARLSPRKRNAKAKWLSEKALQISEKRREVKGKGKRKIYPTECRLPENSKE